MKAAIAVYESPQARRIAEDVRRKVALALQSLGEEVTRAQQPRFNRPEDAEGFIESSGALQEPGVDADEDSKRRQREELMYWNAVRLENLQKKEKERPQKSRGSSFDDFLQAAEGTEKGTFVLQSTGNDVSREEGLRQRGMRRAVEVGSSWANPFGDEHGIELSQESGVIINEKDGERYEIQSQGLYSANDSPRPVHASVNELVDVSDDPPISIPDTSEEWRSASHIRNIPISTPTLEAEAAFASIHAWATHTNASTSTQNGFYSPLPTTPRALSPSPSQQPLHHSIPASTGEEEFDDPPESVPGDLTPTDSMSIIDGGSEIWGPRSGATSEFMGLRRDSDGDVVSVDDSEGEGADRVLTPSSWSEVASVISEIDEPIIAR